VSEPQIAPDGVTESAERFRSKGLNEGAIDRICIVGMGRVGLPLAIAFAQAGLRVTGLEEDPVRRTDLEAGKMPFHASGTDEPLLDAVTSGRFTVHEDPAAAIPDSQAIILTVGTPLSVELRADYGQIYRALASVAPHLRAGQLLILRSTVSPGTLTKIVVPYLRARVPDVAPRLLLASCPERIAEGRQMEELRTLPEIVGGIDEESTHAASALFGRLNPGKRIHLTDPMSAELAKLFTNVYRYVNFALANEFAILGEYYRVDTHRILEMVNAEYPRANVPMPGPAGGPCLSKDGYFLVEELTLPDFVLIAGKLNDTLPAYVVRRLARRLDAHGVSLENTPIAVLGKTFKRDSDDVRNSPAVRIIETLAREGVDVRAHDAVLDGRPVEESLAGARAFVLATNHSRYEALDPKEVAELMDEPRVGLDCWGMLDRDRFQACGIDLATFGVGEEL
jgi:UDP-N-acetyl-D-mannosaminuronic acid dehydrogenase